MLPVDSKSSPSFVSFPLPPPLIVSSEPSAKWVLIYPDLTVVELCSGTEPESDSRITSATTNTSLSHHSPSSDSSIEDDEKKDGYTSYEPNRRPTSTASTGFSGESSVDLESNHQESSSTSNHTSMMLGSFFNWLKFPNLRNASIPRAIVVNEQEQDGEEESVYPVVTREPNKNREGLQGEAAAVKLHQLNPEISERSALCVRSSNVTPEPRPSRSTGLIDEQSRPVHKRNLTYSEGDFGAPSTFSLKPLPLPTMPGRTSRLSALVSTPPVDANVRVQPHSIVGLRHSYERISVGDSGKPKNLWCLEKAFDVFIHPSTLPELYHYLRTTSSDSYLVELLPVKMNKQKASDNSDMSAVDGSFNPSANQSAEAGGSSGSDPSLPHSIVVRLCFATSIVVSDSCMYGKTNYLHSPKNHSRKLSLGAGESLPILEEIVKEGNVVMSDLLRQQLEIHECSRVRLMNVQEKWKMNIADGINITVHFVYPDKVRGVVQSFHSAISFFCLSWFLF